MLSAKPGGSGDAVNKNWRIGKKPTIRVHVRADGSEFVIRLDSGRQQWDHDCYAPNMGVAKTEIEKRGGRIETRARRAQNEVWDETLMPELRARVRRASGCL